MKKRKIFLIVFILICIIMLLINIARNVLIIKNINKLAKEFLENPENIILSVIAVDGYDDSEEYIDDSMDYDEDIPYYEETNDNTVNEDLNIAKSENVVENITENTQVSSSNTIDTLEIENVEDENYDVIENESNDEEVEEDIILEDGYEKIDINKVKIPFYDIVFQIIKSDEYFYKIKINKSTIYVNKNTGLIQKEELENNKVITYLMEE